VRTGEQVRTSDALVPIGVSGEKTPGLNCDGCGFASCGDMARACSDARYRRADYPGPNLVLKVTDPGIAVGSAVRTERIHNADNRIAYSAGVGTHGLGIIMGWSIVYGIPLKASGPNIDFAAAIEH
jgi:uncharacterized ferredoxin-like protein